MVISIIEIEHLEKLDIEEVIRNSLIKNVETIFTIEYVIELNCQEKSKKLRLIIKINK